MGYFKGVVYSALVATATVIGMGAGGWLWGNVLEGKLNNVKERLTQKEGA